jgi:hypothetical protein
MGIIAFKFYLLSVGSVMNHCIITKLYDNFKGVFILNDLIKYQAKIYFYILM